MVLVNETSVLISANSTEETTILAPDQHSFVRFYRNSFPQLGDVDEITLGLSIIKVIKEVEESIASTLVTRTLVVSAPIAPPVPQPLVTHT